MMLIKFGLAKMKVVHAQPAKYKGVRYLYIQRNALYGRELKDNLPLLVFRIICIGKLSFTLK